MKESYWARKRLSRRNVLRGIGLGTGVLALSLVGCGDDDDSPSDGGNATSAPSGGGSATSAPSGSGSATTTPSNGGSVPSQGIQGGTFVAQPFGYPGGFALVTSRLAALAGFGGLVHSGLLAFNYGTVPSDGVDVGVEPDLALALPEQADELTYSFKIRPAKFHNGRDLTAEDVKYSYDRFAFGEGSVAGWSWLDSVEAPDPETVVVRTKSPYADALYSFAADTAGFILAQEFEEGPDAATSMMGSGPFMFVETQSPVSTTFRRNPDYYNQPLPYFDEIIMPGTNDPAKQVADFISGSVHQTYWLSEEPRDQIKSSRSDSVLWSYPYAAFQLHMRTDQAPFNDRRVRQALSMSIDREMVRTGVSKGEGEDDQLFSPANGAQWGFSKPSELGAAAVSWQYDPQAALQLLSAANVTVPLEFPFSHPEPAVLGSAIADTATLAQANWKQLGIANALDVPLPGPTWFSTNLVGDYEGMGISSGLQFNMLGTQLRGYLAEGLTPPTRNLSHIDDAALREVMEKQMGQLDFEERKQSLNSAAQMVADEMYWIPFSTQTRNYFTDPALRNNIVPVWAFSGSYHYFKYQWFDKS